MKRFAISMTKERSYLRTGHCAPKYELSCSTCDPFEFYSPRPLLMSSMAAARASASSAPSHLTSTSVPQGIPAAMRAIGDLPLTSFSGDDRHVTGVLAHGGGEQTSRTHVQTLRINEGSLSETIIDSFLCLTPVMHVAGVRFTTLFYINSHQTVFIVFQTNYWTDVFVVRLLAGRVRVKFAALQVLRKTESTLSAFPLRATRDKL